jgi:glucan phosphorylase
MSLIDESGERYVRMAHLACVGSHAINGVAEPAFGTAQARRAEGFLRAVAGKNSATRPTA